MPSIDLSVNVIVLTLKFIGTNQLPSTILFNPGKTTSQVKIPEENYSSTKTNYSVPGNDAQKEMSTDAPTSQVRRTG